MHRFCRFRGAGSNADYPSKGMALLEVLIAVAVSVGIATAVFAVFHVCTTALRGHATRRNVWRPSAEFLDSLRQELTCALVPAAHEGASFVLLPPGEGAATNPLVFSFYASPADPSERDLRWVRMQRLRYTLAPGPAPALAGMRVVRESFAATVTSSVPLDITVTPLPAVERVDVRVFDGQGWTNSWASAALPSAVRLAVRFAAHTGLRDVANEFAVPSALEVRAAGARGEDVR